MSRSRKLIGCIIGIAALALLARETPYRMELGRRHHQIGQLWTFCRMYYCPHHDGHFPQDLNELTRLPEYATAREYWVRALSEIELNIPGSNGNDGGSVVLLREKKADQRGFRAFHEENGIYGFTVENSSAPPRPAARGTSEARACHAHFGKMEASMRKIKATQ